MIVLPSRRPALVVLAVTNLTAAMTWFDDATFRTSPLFATMRTVAPVGVWAAWWAVAAVALLVAAWLRSSTAGIVGLGLSLSVWTAGVTGTLVQHFAGRVHLSPVALALYVWVAAGQAALVFGALWRPRP